MGNSYGKTKIIFVDIKYSVVNGLIGMNRDIIMKLIKQMNCHEKIRNIIGIAKILYEWSKLKIFGWAMFGHVDNLVGRFLNNGARHVKNTGSKLTWKDRGYSTFLVDTEMTKGVYGINIEKDGVSYVEEFGLARKELLHTLTASKLSFKNSGTCCISRDYINCGEWCTPASGPYFFSKGKVSLRLELDVDNHVLYFFVEGALIPHSIVNVPPSVHFAVSAGVEPTTVEIKSLTKLGTPTASKGSVLILSKHDWNIEEEDK